jgi:hypothetical protein
MILISFLSYFNQGCKRFNLTVHFNVNIEKTKFIIFEDKSVTELS